MKKRLLSLLLALAMVLTLLPAPALAAEETTQTAAPVTEPAPAAEPDAAAALAIGTRVSGRQSNPLYGGEDALRGYVIAPQYYSGTATLSTDDFLTDDIAVLEAIAAGMEQRKATITVPWRISAADANTEDELLSMILAAFALAVSHNGVPTQGDSLLFGYSYLEYGGEVVSYKNGYYYINAIYNLTYYTTAAQEAELTTKLEQVMASFGFTAETDDYTKVKTIYDYICANVAYDEEHMNDEDYPLMFSAYAALINGKAVCQGYATLLYRMLLMAGIDNRVIAGTDTTNVGHAWNIVQLDNFYYNLDSTWDAGYTEYEFFLRCPANFPGHTRLEAYDTEDFHSVYPMAAADYVPGAQQPIAQGTCGEGVNWVLGTDGILTVSGTGAMDDYASASAAPWYDYRDYILGVVVEEGVQHVGNYAFCNCDKMQAVSCAARSIGASAFDSCDILLAVDLPEGVESIGTRAFAFCTSLLTITLPSTLQSLEDRAFVANNSLNAIHITDLSAWCAIDFSNSYSNPLSNGADLYLNEKAVSDLVIPAGITQIKPFVFTYGSFNSVTLPAGVKSIENFAFYEAAISKLNLPLGLESIGNSAFYMCKNLTSLVIPEGVRTIGDNAFFRVEKLSEVSLPSSLESIGVSAFSMCQSLDVVVVPEGVKTIAASAFYSVYPDSIHLPSTLEFIGSQAFSGCTPQEFHITDLAAWCSVTLEDRYCNPLWYGEGDMYLNGVKVTNLVIPAGVEEIKSFTFYNGTYTSVTIPAGVKTIGTSAFAESDVAKLTLPEGLLVLDASAFAGCLNLTELTLPETLTTIGPSALNYTGIKTLRIPASVTTIDSTALSANYYLTTVYFDGDAPSFGKNCFNRGTITAYYPAGNPTWTKDVMQNYGGTVTWTPDFTGHNPVTIPGTAPTCTETGLTDGVECADCGLILVAQETLPITHEYVDGFCNLCGKPEFDISGTCGDGVTWSFVGRTLTISGSGAMDDYIKAGNPPWYGYRGHIQHIVIEEGVTHLGNYAFADISTDRIVLPDSLRSIGNYSFLASGATSVTFGSSPLTIGACAFSMNQFVEVHIPDNVTAIGQYCFSRCDKLETISIGSGVKELLRDTFDDCTSLKNVILSEGLETLGFQVFWNCPALTTLTLPASLKSIDKAFRDCDNLKKVIFQGDRPKAIGKAENANIGAGPCFYPCTNHTWNSDFHTGFGTFCVPNHLCENGVCTLCGSPEFYQYGQTFGGGRALWTLDVNGTLTYYGDGVNSSAGVTSSLPSDSYSQLVKTVIFKPEITHLTDYVLNHNWENVHTLFFLGNAPEMSEHCLADIQVTAYYPADNPTWTADKLQNYGGKITWKPACVNGHTYVYTSNNDATAEADGTKTGICSFCTKTETVADEGSRLASMAVTTAPNKTNYLINEPAVDMTGAVATVTCADGRTFTVDVTNDMVTGFDTSAAGTNTLTVSYRGLTAACDVTVGKATVIFQYADGTVISSAEYNYGDAVVIPPEPEKPAGTDPEYIFRGWGKVVSPTCTESVIYTAVFGPKVLPGDFTNDDLVTNEDVSYLLWHTLFPADYPLNNDADFTGDGAVTNEDVSYLLWHTLFPADYPL